MSTFARTLVVASLVAVLAGCQPTAAPDMPSPEVSAPVEPAVSPTVELVASVIPSSCDLPEMVELIDGLGFPGAIDVTPPWDPADGTDLELALDNGGIACAWGPPYADAGVTVYWVPVTDELWSQAVDLWESSDMDVIDVPGLTEDAAYFTYLPASEDSLYPRWELNVRFADIWIQVATSSWENPAEGNAVVDAALEIATP
jgi:hypothetical protein